MRLALLALLSCTLPLAATGTLAAKAKALGNPDLPQAMACADCHEGPATAKAKGGAFKGPGKYLVERKETTGAKQVDVAWLKDYRKPKAQ